MSKNHDNDQVTKGAVKKAIRPFFLPLYGTMGAKLIIEAIDKLPAILPNSRQAGEIKSPEQIERAIKRLRSWGQGEQGEETVSIYTGRQVAVILEYALGLRLEKTVPGVIRKLFAEADKELLG